jgi:hypothetical protein
METVITKVSLYYDSQRQGYDSTVWQTLTGLPYVNGDNNLEFNAASAIGVADINRGEVTFFLTVPTAPEAGDVREWGLYQINSSAAVTFKVTDDEFTAYVSDIDGNTESQTLTWLSTWTNTETKFKILYTPGLATFYIGSDKVAVFNDDGPPNGPLSLYVKNSESDPMALSHIQIRDSEFYVLDAGGTGSSSSGSTSPSTTQSPYTQYQNDSFTTVNVKSTPGHVYSFVVTNTTTSARYLQLHNTTTTPASGDTPEFKILVPANGIVSIGTDVFGTVGNYFSSGIAVANSTTATTYTAGTTGDLILELFYDGALTTTVLLLEDGSEMLLEIGDLILQE